MSMYSTWDLIAMLALLSYIIPIWIILGKVINKYTKIDTSFVIIKALILITAIVIGTNSLNLTLKVLDFIYI